MGLLVTLKGDAGNYLIKGAIWELGASSYRAYVHLVPFPRRGELPRAVVTVGGPTLQKVLDAAAARVRTTAGTPVQNLTVRAALPNSEGTYAPHRG